MGKPRASKQVFISWSGKRSLAVAESLCVFIPRVIPQLKDRLFVSTGIEKGSRWCDEIARHLEEADAGILCLTAEGLASPWLHFEAGALTKGLDASRSRRAEEASTATNSRIFTYLHGLSPHAFTGPLAQYQWTSATRDDTWRLMSALHDLFAPGTADARAARRRFDDRWPELEQELRRNAVLVADVIPEFESWFQRKTFVESLAECTDKNWIARYDGARDTYSLLVRHADRVRDGVAQYERELYHQLVAATDAYVMDLRPLLRALPDDDDDTAAVSLDVAAACERERLRVNNIVQLILHPVAIPAVDDAVAFSVTDSIEQRKMLAEQYEDTMREICDRRRTSEIRTPPHDHAHTGEHPTTGHPALEAMVATADGTRALLRSLWALDRILGYLAWKHLYSDTPGSAELLVQRASSELEALQSQDVDANPLPLQYSLRALASAVCAQAHRVPDLPAITRLCGRIDEAIDASRTSDGEPMIDRGKTLRATLSEVRKALATVPATAPLPATAPGAGPDPLEDA